MSNFGDDSLSEASLVTALPILLGEAGVDRAELESVERPASFRGSSVSDEAKVITASAREEHLSRGFGFWEFALEQSVETDWQTRRGLLKGALKHSPNSSSSRFTLSVNELGDRLATGAWEGMPARTMVNLCSRVLDKDGLVAHLVMLDFGVSSEVDSAPDVACEVVAELGLRGAVFSSGRSFHFISNELMTEKEFISTLASAQLLSPLIDSRWISHQLIDLECKLRISTDSERNRVPHKLIDYI